MPSVEEKSNETEESKSNANEPVIPDWVNEDNFTDLLKEIIPRFGKLTKFDATLTGGAGENYASVMVRVKITAEPEGAVHCLCCRGDDVFAFMIKTLPQSETGVMMVNMMGLFPKELTMYNKYIPEFEQMYLDAGKKVTFGPKFYRFPKKPDLDYVLLEDLGRRRFKNQNRIEGLDKEHTESALRLLAELHAVSAVRFETRGPYDPNFMENVFNESSRAMLEGVGLPLRKAFQECLAKHESCRKYLDKVKEYQSHFTDMIIEKGQYDPKDFNVLNHGDLWCNNIMFRHNDEGKREETIFVDYQVSRYGTPAIDLYYFLLSSTKLELKLSHFDYFIKYYHDHLVENLKLLSYPKEIPLLKELRIQMIKQNFWGFSTIVGVMAALLLDPTDSANLDNFMNETADGQDLKNQMFSNPRYLKHMEAILPWLDTRGLLE